MPATLTDCTSALEIRAPRTAQEVAAIERLRYDVYVTEMGRRMSEADHTARRLGESLDAKAIVLGAFTTQGTCIGTIRVNDLIELGSKGAELYEVPAADQRPGSIAIATRLIVEPERRGGTLGVALCCAMYLSSLRAGFRTIRIDTNAHLLPLYERLGMRRIGAKHHEVYGDVTILELDMFDEAHLRAVRSPLLRTLRTFRNQHAA